MSFQLAANEIAGNNATAFAIDIHNIQHFVTGHHLYRTHTHLPLQCTVGSEQQLLPGLSCSVKSTLYLGAAKRTVAQGSSIFTGKGNALGHTLVNDTSRDLGKTVYVSLTGSVITAFYCIIK